MNMQRGLKVLLALLVLGGLQVPQGLAIDRPIVGILSEEVAYNRFVQREYGKENYTSYIAASYVKFVEGAGGRVVPIWIGKPRAYYEDLLTKINAVMLPGGSVYFNNTGGYGVAGAMIIDIAMEMNERHIYMPVWGTCLGMELLVYHLADGIEPRTRCNSTWQALPLRFKRDFRNSRLFKESTIPLIAILQDSPVTLNNHNWCFTEETFEKRNLYADWRVLSVNDDWDGIRFISTLEHIRYPFYGVQFHPEKNIYEFPHHYKIPHSREAIFSAQYFAYFLVNEARKNNNRFSNQTEETNMLIYNYAPKYTGALGSAFTQQYLFRADGAGSGQPSDKQQVGFDLPMAILSASLTVLRLMKANLGLS